MDRRVAVLPILASSTVSGAGAAGPIHVEYYTEGLLFIEATAPESGTPTLDIDVQMDYDEDGDFEFEDTTVSVAQMTQTTQKVVKLTNMGKYLKVSYTPSGSWTLKLTFAGKN